jgi:16S rRNA G966 N2-methylase RsmD
VQFVEISRRATDVIRRNVASLGLAGQTEIQTSDALASLRALVARGATFDLIVADPPYDEVPLRSGMLKLIAAPPSPLATGGLLVLSGRRVKGETTQVAPRGLRLVRGLTYGETAIDFYEHEGAEELR